jgi:hypothetical protein
MKKVLIDMTGQKCGRLTVISRAENKGSAACWNCLCECGKTKVIMGASLRNGKIVSCGCYKTEIAIKRCKNSGYSEDYVKKILIKNGFELISKFNGINNASEERCLKCNGTFKRTLNVSFHNKRSCPLCSNKLQNNTFICHDYFIRNPHMKNIPYKVYFLKFYGNDEKFYKIGVTKREIKKRIANIPYNLVECKYEEMSFYEAYLLEKELKNKLKEFRYTPKIKFGGWTECFDRINI